MKDDDIVVGIIARIQTHRRFHILLQAIKIASNLAKATVKLATDIDLRKKMADASLKKAQGAFSQESMAEKVENVYKELLSQSLRILHKD